MGPETSSATVAATGPYFHAGTVASLDEAIRMMAYHQLGKTLQDADVRGHPRVAGEPHGRSARRNGPHGGRASTRAAAASVVL